MSIRETPPDKGRSSARLRNWSNLKVARGQKHEAYACGKAHWFDCHTRYGVTQPCLKEVTGGDLACPRCAEPVETMGYVALWVPPMLKPMFALVHHEQRDRTDKLQRGQPVFVGRDDDKTAGIYVIERSFAKAHMLKLDSPALLASVDLVPTLLKCWKLPQLTRWIAEQQGVSDNGLSLTPDPVPATTRQRLSVTPPTTEAEALAIDADKKMGGGYIIDPDAVMQRIEERRKSAEKNGAHKPQGGAS